MIKYLLILLMVLGLFSYPAPSKAADLSLVGGLNNCMPSGATTWSSKSSFGFGALIASDNSPILNLEIGIIYVPRKFLETLTERNLTVLEFPVLLKVTAIPFIFFGVGGYYARVIDANGADTVFDSNDYGLGADIGLRLPIAPKIGLMADLRYLFGLANVDKRANTTLNMRNFEILVGLTISF